MHGTTEADVRRSRTRRPAPGADRDRFVRDIYDAYGPSLQRYASRLLGGDAHKAEDILQETAVRAWTHSHVLNGRDEHLRRWLFTVVRNLVTDHHRAAALRPLNLMPTEALEAVWEIPEHTLTLHMVHKAVMDLSEQQRAVIGLMYYLEYTVAQAAEYLGIPPGTVKSRAFYAVRALREALKDGEGHHA
ncbi:MULTISPECIES: sigma-70 family RNA polymerase sigma factor [Streptomyces]|uniref:Sigma-70 family RNA polymerase sigma factor n=1 Tax=Streptomyces lienomycini TaxID=284035 RepID=A0ABV9X9S4_9ACTN|nr:sigma-70 family RNA polymerase sigma factor [Streptomyces sp. NBC_00334]